MSDAAMVAELLDQWSLPPPVAMERVKQHRVWIAHFADRPSLVLKNRGDAGAAAKWSLEFHTSVMTHLAAHGVGVPLPLRARDGRPFADWAGDRYTLSRYQRAASRPDNHEDRIVLYQNVGAEIARMHRALASYPREGLERLTWREDLVEWVAEWAEALADAVPDVAEIVRPAQAAFAELGREQLIHRDCHTSNVLVDATLAVGFVDCDHFCIGPPIFDLAYYAIHLVKWEVDDTTATTRWLEYVAALLDGFGASTEERMAFPYVLSYVLMLFARAPHIRTNPDAFQVELIALAWVRENVDLIAAVCA